MTRIIIARVTRENIKKELDRIKEEEYIAKWGHIIGQGISSGGCTKCGGHLIQASKYEYYCEECGRVC